MATEALKAAYGVQLRAISGALAVVDRPLPLFNLGGFRRATIHLLQEANLALPDGDDIVRFHFDTAYGAGPFVDSTANTVGAMPAGGGNVIPNVVATLDTTDGTQFVVGDIIQLGTEELLVTAIAVNVLTVRRGQNGTGVLAHVTATDIFLQDVDWVEVAQITYNNADDDASAPSAVIVIGSTSAAPIIVDDLDVALADNTILALPLGDRLRLRTTIAGATAPTYNYSARVALQN